MNTASTEPDRPDLAAMVVPLGRALTRLEEPIVREHGLAPWAYTVLTALAEGPLRTQSALAERIRADKTRLIPVLDDLQQRGLIERRPDPADRRVRLLAATVEGREKALKAQAEIRQREDDLLDRLPPEDRRSFLRALRTLAGNLP
ncbi:winged helix-turn-helix transcriptional regulator [Amycolatopsis rhizosphaerae]|uniref:Winged helix-turn-helix transcriptional regulator n=1 Tax=Amycolatopsis rhizosphaerae TaxID=2053003 RepID=A0A558D3Z9_9PSEU|nr:MarR family winged helix-turn-helix transcriptional regulator [Amycolatopsis rhizosphaerae]TVT55732.1 winged helix-turn-helix transcriptional regulator [Amycolatopsis rhizosphaerae]